MRVGFVFDTVLLKKYNNYYGQTLTYDFFKKRYLDKCNEMSIITRSSSYHDYRGDLSGYKITNGENVFVNTIDEYKSIPDAIIKKSKIILKLKNELQKCDKVIIRMPSVLGIFSCNICKKNNIPYMIEMVACPWDGYINHTDKKGKMIALFMYALTKSKIKECDYVLYVTSDFLQKRYPSKGKMFSCSDVELKAFDEKVLKKRLKKLENFNPKEYSLCTVANVGMRYKGHIYAFRAIKKLKSDGINVKYYLVGNGNQSFLKNQIKKLDIQDNVIFLGSLNHDQVFECLDNIDIYIQPSLQEGLPRALVEAMSRGCVCVGSNVGGIPELLEDSFIFKKKNYIELYKILKKLDINLIIEQSRFNYEKAKSFSKEVLDQKRNKIYANFFGVIK